MQCCKAMLSFTVSVTSTFATKEDAENENEKKMAANRKNDERSHDAALKSARFKHRETTCAGNSQANGHLDCKSHGHCTQIQPNTPSDAQTSVDTAKLSTQGPPAPYYQHGGAQEYLWFACWATLLASLSPIPRIAFTRSISEASTCPRVLLKRATEKLGHATSAIAHVAAAPRAFDGAGGASAHLVRS
jgi:hypothetical protein